jgi:AcrR family transcriptional regulator
MARKQTARRVSRGERRPSRPISMSGPGPKPVPKPLPDKPLPDMAPTQGIRAARAAERRDAILAAALEEFAASGFAATRLDDVARRAGVAKGTIYLYFRDKESLFQELVRSMLSPVIGGIETAQVRDVPARMIAEMIADIFVREIFGTRRKDVLRLIITEGARFPKIAEFYYHEVIERVTAALRAMLSRAVARGELSNDALVRFPQLLVSPALMALVWNGMFDRFAPLDIRELMRAHLELLFGDKPSQDNPLQRTSS